MDDGFVLTCVAYPTSDTVTLLAEQEETYSSRKMNGRLDKVAMTNRLMQLKRELHYKCEIGEKGEWECNGTAASAAFFTSWEPLYGGASPRQGSRRRFWWNQPTNDDRMLMICALENVLDLSMSSISCTCSCSWACAV